MTRSLALVSGSIAPYSNRLFDAMAAAYGLDMHVFVCAEREPERKWDVPPPKHYRLKVLNGMRVHRNSSHVYVNPGILGELAALRPSAIVLGSLSPTMLMAGGYALAKSIPLGISTDGALQTDPGRHSFVHRRVREWLIPRATFGIGASEASVELLVRYGLAKDRCAVVPLVPAWDAPRSIPTFEERPFDVLFCGVVEDRRKGVLFFCDVLERCKAKGVSLRARIVGDGPLRHVVEQRLRSSGLDVKCDGYLQAAQLPEAYASSKLMLFPTKSDPWGLVANEATLCGTPVIASPHAISSIELVDRYRVGEMIDLDVEAWSEVVIAGVSSRSKWQRWQDNRAEALASFDLNRAVNSYGSMITRVMAMQQQLHNRNAA